MRLALLLLAAVLAWWQLRSPERGAATAPDRPGGTAPRAGPTAGETGEAAVLRAFRAHRSNVQVEVVGRVVFLFPPDRDARPHQRFLLALPSGHTLKVAHNLTLADPVPLHKDDTVRVRGEYEYNAKGGVVHWTHDDPAGRHPGGWIRHAGRTYR